MPCVDGLLDGPADLSLTRGRGVFSATLRDVSDLQTVAATARRAGKLWAAATGNLNYRAEALSLEPAFITTADNLSALYAGFKSRMK